MKEEINILHSRMPRSTQSKQAAPFRYNPPKISAPPPMKHTPAPPPAIHIPAPPPQISMMQSMKEGFGLGIGSSIAHNVVGRMFGAPAYTPSQAKPQKPCAAELKAFENCLLSEETRPFCGDQQHAYTECVKLNK